MSIKEIVRAKLDGQELRQRQRDAARRCGNQLRLLYVARKQHRLDDLEAACTYLTHTGIHWSNESWYGIVMVYAGGATLVYGPDGKFQSHYAPRVISGEPDQTDLFSDETPTFDCGAPCQSASSVISSGCCAPLFSSSSTVWRGPASSSGRSSRPYLNAVSLS